MNKKKTEYLSYLEDTKKYYSKIEGIDSIAVKNAKDKKLDITYLKGEDIIKESPSGKTTIIHTQHIERRKVKVGSKDTLSKRA